MEINPHGEIERTRLPNIFKKEVYRVAEPISERKAPARNSRSLARLVKANTRLQPNMQFLNNPELVELLTKYGNNPDGIPTLLFAIKQNDHKAVRMLLENGASINTKVDQWCLPRNYIDVGGAAGIDGNNTRPINPIEYAAAYGDKKMLCILEDFGACFDIIYHREKDITSSNQFVNNLIQVPVIFAINRDNLETFEFIQSKCSKTLLETSEELSEVTGGEDIDIITMASRAGAFTILKKCFETDKQILWDPQKVFSFLSNAIGRGNQETLNFLLNFKISQQVVEEQDVDLLQRALWVGGDIEIVKKSST